MLKSVPADAVRGRRELLRRELGALVRKSPSVGRFHVMSLACGPALEFCDFLSACECREHVEALLVDIDAEALQRAGANVNRIETGATIRFMRENLIRWALGRVRQHFGLQDVIYSAGLTDYLGRSLFTALIRKCFEHLKPGGTLIIGNFGPANPHRAFMDHLLKWELIHRSEADLRDIFEDTPFGGDAVEILMEKHGVNLFVRAVKSR
jgi:SAM-dependent methyltransferase